MAIKASLIMAGVAIGLLVIYGADVAASMGNEAKEGFLPIDDMARGVGLGTPALILPIVAFFISMKEKSKPLGIMIIVAGILIIIGGVAVLANPSPAAAERNPIASAAMLLVPAAVQIGLGAIKLKK